MKSRSVPALLIAAGFAFPAAGHATSHTHDAHHAASAAPLASGEVRKVDLDARKITIRHGPLDNLGMPPMTMVFQVSDAALLKQVKPGDKIRFSAEKKDGAYTVTSIQPH